MLLHPAAQFGLVPAEYRGEVVSNLVENILVEHQGHLSVGLVGMQWFMQTLTECGPAELAFRSPRDHSAQLGLHGRQRRHFGLGAMGPGHARSRDERREPVDPRRQPGRLVLPGPGGINYDPAAPGFKHVILRPRPVGGLTWVTASHKSLYGTVRSDWCIEKGVFRLELAVPPNTQRHGVCTDPRYGGRERERTTGPGKPPGVRYLREEENAAVYDVTSGTYGFLRLALQGLPPVGGAPAAAPCPGLPSDPYATQEQH